MSNIIAVRLKPFNPKRDDEKTRTYVSANSESKYVAGLNGIPSNWRILNPQRIDVEGEIDELTAFSRQFEIKEFSNVKEIEDLVMNEMEESARMGFPAVRAKIEGNQKPRPARKKPRVDLSAMLGEIDGDDDDADDDADDGIDAAVKAKADLQHDPPSSPPNVAAKTTKKKKKKNSKKTQK